MSLVSAEARGPRENSFMTPVNCPISKPAASDCADGPRLSNRTESMSVRLANLKN